MSAGWSSSCHLKHKKKSGNEKKIAKEKQGLIKKAGLSQKRLRTGLTNSVFYKKERLPDCCSGSLFLSNDVGGKLSIKAVYYHQPPHQELLLVVVVLPPLVVVALPPLVVVVLPPPETSP
jgi:hypothetical protein